MLANYIKTALKVLRRRKFFTFISLFGISFTLVVLMVAVAMLDNVFSPRQPESRFDHVLGVHTVGLYGPHFGMTTNPGYGFINQYVRGLKDVENMSLFTTSSPLTMYHEGRKIDTHLRRTDGAYWQILDFKFLEGGPFTEEDNRNANFVAVITDEMRRTLFNGQSALGRTIELDGQRFRVIGVVPAVAITRNVGFSEVWAPVGTLKTREHEKRMIGDFGAIVLARSPRDFAAIRREFKERLANFVFEDPKNFDRVEAGLDTPFELVARNMIGNQYQGNRVLVLQAILVLMALLFVTLPTMNLVSINLSRILERASEIGVRKAFGASSVTLIGQFVVENVVLTLIGGAIGFVLSVLALSAVARLEIVPFAVFDVNLRIFGYGVLLSAAFGIISGVYPAWRMSRMQPVNALRGGVL
ncbi:MAG TPA: ABC transporter permease [Thermoanaerobaculia bacterium]|nr:ABC transporter permease [Thermoanaerobaculia bacterium]